MRGRFRLRVPFIPENERRRRPVQLVVTICFLIAGVSLMGAGVYPMSQTPDAITVVGGVLVVAFGLLLVYTGILGVLGWRANRSTNGK